MGANIPLPALDIHSQQSDPLSMYAKLMAIKSGQNQQALQKEELIGAKQGNQLQAAQIEEQKTLMDTSKGIDWKQPNAFDNFLSNAQQSGKVRPQTLSQMALQRATYQEQLAKTDTATLAAENSRNDQLLGHLDAISKETDPARRAAVAQAQASQILSGGLVKDPSIAQKVQAMAQGQYVPNDDELKIFEGGLLDHKTQTELAIQGKEADTRAAQAKNSADRLAAELPGGALRSPELQAQDAWLKKNPGKDASDYQEHMKKLVPAFNFNLQSQTGAGQPAGATAQQFGMTPVAFDQAAEKYWTTGTLPPIGRGTSGPALNKALMNRAAELHPSGSLAANSAEYKANEDSLKKIQTNLDSVSAFENTANKNLDLFLQQAKNVIDTGSPLINQPLRMIDKKVLGSADQAAYEAARQVAVNEIAKVTGSPGLSGQLTDSARHEVDNFNPNNATLAQTYKVAQILRQDMANRHQSYQDQINDIKGRMGGAATSSGQSQFKVPAGAPPPPAEDGHKLKMNGSIVAISKGGQWIAP